LQATLVKYKEPSAFAVYENDSVAIVGICIICEWLDVWLLSHVDAILNRKLESIVSP
jgi:hypothetical protein